LGIECVIDSDNTSQATAGLLEKIKPTLPYMQPKKQAKTPIS
jgi:hypothetical protein